MSARCRLLRSVRMRGSRQSNSATRRLLPLTARGSCLIRAPTGMEALAAASFQEISWDMGPDVPPSGFCPRIGYVRAVITASGHVMAKPGQGLRVAVVDGA